MSMLAVTRPEEFIEFLEDDESAHATPAERAWKVLIVDDDAEVHQATLFALRGVTICGRKLELLNAASSLEARAVLERNPDVAVILLDVVMESHDAGLALVRVIREELGRRDTRIILRTGQPGYAPELSVIRDYDINDYRTKSELTHTRLITTLTAAIRSYEQIGALDESRRGLELLIETGNQLFVPRDVQAFADAALRHLEGFFGAPLSAVFYGPSDGGLQGPGGETPCILAASGDYRELAGKPLSDVGNEALVNSLRSGLAARRHVFDTGSACLYIGRTHGKEALIHVDLSRPATELTLRMIEVLCVSLGVGFENVVLFERLRFFAYYDPLTRLPNRTRFLDRIDEELPTLTAGGWLLGIIDIVRFAELNDALGHRSGDLLLVEVTRRLQAWVGPDALVARVAGAAFGVCWRSGRETAPAILDVFAVPFTVRGHAIPMRARAGFVDLAPTPGGAVELLKRANLALSHAKQAGSQHWQFFSGDMESSTQNRVRLLTELRSALQQGKGLRLHYQPQVASGSTELLGCEALIRWVKPSGEMVSPEVFIPLAEYTGMIVDIGEWVISEACRQVVRWDAQGMPGFRMGINISAAQFREADFVAKTARIITESGVDPARLEFEITESVAMEDPLSVANQLRELKALGLRVAVDDFGCGFSSLGSLNRLPFDRVKIDRAFVRELTPETKEDCIATMIIRLAKSLGLEVIAEGVETHQQAGLLEEMGCQEMQGFLYASPMGAEALEQWIAGRGLVSH